MQALRTVLLEEYLADGVIAQLGDLKGAQHLYRRHPLGQCNMIWYRELADSNLSPKPM